MSQPIRGQGGHLVFPIGPKNTNLVEDVEILLPVKFCWIPFSGFRGEVEIVSANQRPGWPSCFSDQPKKHKLGRGRWDLASCQVSLNCVQPFQRRSQNVSANQRQGRPSCFSDQLEKHKLGRGCWDLAFCQVWLNSVQWFQRRSRICESLRWTPDGRTPDGRRTDDGRCAMTIAHLSLRLRWANKQTEQKQYAPDHLVWGYKNLCPLRQWSQNPKSPFMMPTDLFTPQSPWGEESRYVPL